MIVEFLNRRRRDVAEQWNLRDAAVVIGAGEPVPVPGRGDRTYPFRSHSEYLYLTDRERPGGVLAFDPQEGWVDFVVPISADELLWEGPARGANEGIPVAELPRWLGARSGRAVACLGAPVAGVTSDASLEVELRMGLNEVRRRKDALELSRMREAEQATSAGFAAVAALIEPGKTERELQIELEAEFFRNGADFLAFDTILASGPNSAILHAQPSDRVIEEQELVLIDAGAEYRGYASDITRTYPSSGAFTPEQHELHSLVRAAGLAAADRCTPGTEFKEVHRAASLIIAQGLIGFGLLHGEPETLVERGTVSLFFPHGVGHMVGLGVRDAGAVLPGRRPKPEAFPGLRIDLPLMPSHVVTIEPGIYFVPALLGDPKLRERHRGAVNWQCVEQMLHFGGIRIEDNVLVTDDGYEVLTADVPLPGGGTGEGR